MNFNLNIVLDNRLEERQICPKCGSRSLYKYVDIISKEILPEENGCCRGIGKCDYNVFPKIKSDSTNRVNEKELLKFGYQFHETNSLPIKYYKFTYTVPSHRAYNSMSGFENTNFAKFLISFLNHDAIPILLKYYVGHDYEPLLGGETYENVFWKIDDNFTVRHGLITDYLPNGKRIKTLPQDEYKYSEYYTVSFFNCFFGAHLVNIYPDKDIAIVEDEKSAIVCSHFWPEYNWLATGQIDSLDWTDYRVYNVLNGKNVTLYSDNDNQILSTSTIKWSYWHGMAIFFKTEIDCAINVKLLLEDKIKTLNHKDQLLILALLKN